MVTTTSMKIDVDDDKVATFPIKAQALSPRKNEHDMKLAYLFLTRPPTL